MTPQEALVHLSVRLQQAGQPEAHLLVCHACWEALLNDLDTRLIPIEGRHTRLLEHSTVMGFTFSAGPLARCALHPLLHED